MPPQSAIPSPSFAVGSLVRARGREWVVLPESADELLVLRPLGGTEDEVTGLYLPLETVEPAQFGLPDPGQVGDFRSCRLLRDAVRLGFRSSAGPFRSFARIAVEPRPYQLVPLLMALKQDPVRMLIADDVGVGKTIEACLIARELLDRGEARRLAVLCPPALAEQWQAELKDKFHIEAELVLSGTVSRLERSCTLGESLFDVFPHVVVSIDFIKADRRRDEFLRSCPELVIVDEAHTCAFAGVGRGGRHQRHELVKGLAADPNRHLVLVTATPHSGNEDAFRSLLGILDNGFADMPPDLTGRGTEAHRRRLAQHFVQRRRADIRHYMEADTPFPDREEKEDTYKLSADYKQLFDRVLEYAREIVQAPGGGRHRQRVRWWSALALLRSLASSPAAAAATLRNRAAVADTETDRDADEIGRRTVLDLEDDEATVHADATPGGDIGEQAADEGPSRRRLLELARAADELRGDKDAKLKKAVDLVKELVGGGFRPILFCRFIDTADYVAEQLRQRLRGVEVASVTGTLPPAEREDRVQALAQAPKRVLVCTDCLSEGINLQQHFDAVLHYDLSWNPTRHEQREGRVDRYGQPKKAVRALTYYGLDNKIDGIVLDVLLRKHRTIRNRLGISVPVPVDTERLVEAIFEGLLLRGTSATTEQQIFEFMQPQKEDLFQQWDSVAEREKRSRTIFAQETIHVEEVARELAEVRSAIGSSVDVDQFTQEAVRRHGGAVSVNGCSRFDLREAPRALRDQLGGRLEFQARFELPVDDATIYLNRTHPVVEALASYIMDTALDPQGTAVARRAGVIRTRAVERRTTLLLVRCRYDIVTRSGDEQRTLLAEDCQVAAFRGAPESAAWLDAQTAEQLWTVAPDENVNPDLARERIQQIIAGFGHLSEKLDELAIQRGRQLLDSHRRVRQASRLRGVSQDVEPKLPADVLGIYVYLPAAGAGG